MDDGVTEAPHETPEDPAAIARAALPAPDDGAWEAGRPDGSAEDLERDDLLPGGVGATPAVAAVGGSGAAALAIAGAIRRRRAAKRLREDEQD